MSQQAAERPKVEVEVLVVEPEDLLELLHAGCERHQRAAQALYGRVVETPGLHAAQRLTLHQLAQQLDQGEDQRGEPALDVLRIGLHAAREDVVEAAQVTQERVEVRRRREELVRGRIHHSPPTNEYGGQGPVHRIASSG